jgi:hypothetical protein
MGAVPLKKLVRNGLDLGFDLGAEIVKDLALIKEGLGAALVPAGSLRVVLKGMVTNYRSRDIDGTAVQVGDEKVLLRAWELAGVLHPMAGDVLEEVSGFLRWVIIAARRDPTGSFWTIQARREEGEDWGDLTAHRSEADWGDLSPHDSAWDLQV